MVGSLFPILHSVYFKPSPFYFKHITSYAILCGEPHLKLHRENRRQQKETSIPFPQDTHISPSFPITKVDSVSHCLLPSYGDCYADYPSNIFNLFHFIWYEISWPCLLISSTSQTSLKHCLHLRNPVLYLPITPQFIFIWHKPMSLYWNVYLLQNLKVTFQSYLLSFSAATCTIIPFFQLKIFFHWFPWHRILPILHPTLSSLLCRHCFLYCPLTTNVSQDWAEATSFRSHFLSHSSYSLCLDPSTQWQKLPCMR